MEGVCGSPARYYQHSIDVALAAVGAIQVSEQRVGDGELIFFKGTKTHASCTIVLRGANDFMLDEMDRSARFLFNQNMLYYTNFSSRRYILTVRCSDRKVSLLLERSLLWLILFCQITPGAIDARTYHEIKNHKKIHGTHLASYPSFLTFLIRPYPVPLGLCTTL